MIRRLKLFLIRKTKATFLRFNLHLVIEPCSNFLLNLVYLSKFSRWRKQNSKTLYNDFYSHKFDFNKRYNLYQFLIEHEKLTGEINYLEFGVSTGGSFKWWINHNKNVKSRFIGFDTFTGLPENWNIYKKGDMSTSGNMPVINDDRHNFITGLFQDTLPDFLKKFNWENKINVINMDADLYTSTIYVLSNLYPYLKAGDIIIFDEFGVPTHEFRAFIDFFNSFYIKYELLAASNNYYQIAVKLVSPK
jgi:hypothetical protein